MDELLSEIDNNICQNMKSLSFVRQKKKYFNKMRAKSNISILKKKNFSASYIINSKQTPTKIGLKLKLNSSIGSKNTLQGQKYISNILPYFSKKNISPLSSKIHISKINPSGEELSTSLTTLIKPSTALYLNNSNSCYNTSSNFYYNSDINNIDTNANYINSLNNLYNINNKSTNNYSFLFSFDDKIKNYLQVNNYLYNKKEYPSNFMEKTRIARKSKIIKDFCQKKVVALNEIKNEELNRVDKNIFAQKKNQKLFFCYFKTLNSYLNKLSDIKEKENEELSILKVKKRKILHEIENINDNIKIIKDKLSTLKDLKKFLFEVKFESFIASIPIDMKIKYGFIKEKAKKTKTIHSRRLSFLERMSNIRKKNIPTKNSKKNNIINSNMQIEDLKNIPIFDYPEEFINSINHLNEKLNENMIYYKTSRETVNNYKSNFDIINKDFNKYYNIYLLEEKKLLDNLNYQKRRNNIFNLKLDLLNKYAINEENTLKKIVIKLKDIILKINSKIKIKNKFNKFNLNLVFSNKNNFEDIKEAISNSYYILKLLEQIIEELISDKNKFKNDINLKEEYRKVFNEIEKANNIKKFKLQISLAKQKLEERNNKIFEKNKIIRLGPFFKNKFLLYEDKINKKPLTKKNLSYKKINLNNIYDESKEWLSFY